MRSASAARFVSPFVRYTRFKKPEARFGHPLPDTNTFQQKLSAVVRRKSSMSSSKSWNNPVVGCACSLLAVGLLSALPTRLAAQALPSQALGQSSGPTAQNFQGSVATGEASAQPIDLSLDDAMQRGLRNNLGAILSGTQTAEARGQRLSQLQSLLPEVDFKAQESLMQVDLAAEGLRFPGIPAVVGPFGYTDLRASLSWSLVDVNSLRSYLSTRHNFAS